MPRSKQFRVEGLERRLFLSSAIAAFGAQQTFATGANPGSVAVADVNSDGKPDLVATNPGSASLGVLLGNGNGTFQPQQTFACGGVPQRVVLSDVNRDGNLDALVGNYLANGSGNICLLLGNGNGTFQTPQTVALLSLPATSLAAADVNGDARPDTIYGTARGAAGINVLLGNGDGTFQSQHSFAANLDNSSIAAADLNGDGKLDLAICNSNGFNTGQPNVSVLLGNGDGTFQPPQSFAGNSPYQAAVADVNGDGKADLVVGSLSGNAVSVLLGNGDGTFQAQQTFAAGTEPRSVAVADVNGDGKPDIAVAHYASNNVSILLGNGDGNFEAQTTFATGAGARSVALADLNRDGRQDLAVANSNGNTLGVLLGDVPPTVLSINRTNPPGPVTSDPSVTYTVTFNDAVTGVDPTDFILATNGVTTTPPIVVNGSGAVYTVTINGISGTGTLGLNLVDDGSIQDAAGNPLQPGGTAAFQATRTFATSAFSSAAAVADLNGDGRPDLVAGNDVNPGSVSVLLGNSGGTFQPQQTFATVPNVFSIVVADVNGDGRADVVAAGRSATSVLLGNGNGTFQPQQVLATGGYSILASDVNGDGKIDVVLLHGSSVGVLLGNGNGTFGVEQTFATTSRTYGAAIADVNGDGKPDLVAASYGSGLAQVFLGNGDGTFQAPQTFATGVRPGSVAVADMNGDGIADLVFPDSKRDGTNASILLGNGNGTFQAPQTLNAGDSNFGSLAVADLNGDGKPDLIVGVLYGVGVLLSNGNGSFRPPQNFFTVGVGPPIAVSDLNGDGRPDVVLAHRGVGVLLAASNDNFTGQTYTIVPLLDTVSGTSGVDKITLVQNPDSQHIDWTLGSTTAEMTISDPNGLTINGNGGGDVITLEYTNGNPLPNIVHLNGTFTINELQGTSPLLNTTLDIGRSTVYISYASPSSDPVAVITRYLQNGYNNGGWNGIPAASPAYPGAITSIPAAQNAKQITAIGYADSADGLITNQPANTIELKYTLYGDTHLLATVGANDFTTLTLHYHQTTGGTWDTGDFNYDGSVNFNDFTLLTRTYNTSLGNQAAPAVSAASVSNSSPVHWTVKHHRKHRRRPAVGKEKD